jgi:hypothetical protein
VFPSFREVYSTDNVYNTFIQSQVRWWIKDNAYANAHLKVKGCSYVA